MYQLSDGRTIQDLVNADKKWQTLRDSLRGTWKEHAKENCQKLRHYMGGSPKSATKEQLVIVMNYLTGTGFRLGIIDHVEINKLKKEISSEIKIRKENNKWFKKG
jgi:hypothetical protein